MTAPILSLTESQTLKALRVFLLAALPAGTEVIKAEDNRVPEPKASNFVVMTPVLRNRLDTNVVEFSDGFFNVPPTPGLKVSTQATMVTVQLDVHGPVSADNSQIITTLFRDQFAVDSFAGSGVAVAPLYCSDPRQMAFSNAEQQTEIRWIVDAVMQANPAVTVNQDFAGELVPNLINVDATYPP